jgi:hypothetical protein
MGIKVVYQNDNNGETEDYLLDDLIRSGRIKAFHRSSGWVIIDRDPIRQMWLKSLNRDNERRQRELPPEYFF